LLKKEKKFLLESFLKVRQENKMLLGRINCYEPQQTQEYYAEDLRQVDSHTSNEEETQSNGH
jgi:hypothetical protein